MFRAWHRFRKDVTQIFFGWYVDNIDITLLNISLRKVIASRYMLVSFTERLTFHGLDCWFVIALYYWVDVDVEIGK